MKHLLTKNILVLMALLFVGIILSSCGGSEDEPEAPEATGSIYGKVIDLEGTPIPGATITLTPGGDNRIADPDGVYEFKDIEPKQYTLTVQNPGYNTQRKIVKVEAGKTTQAYVSLTKIN